MRIVTGDLQMGRRECSRRDGGFTLVELLITLLIVSILLGVAAPAFIDLLERNRLETTSTQFMTTLMAARSEALKRNQPVVTCKSVNGSSCVNAGGWERGWMTYADEDADGLKDGSEPVLSVHERLPSGDTLRVSGTDFNKRIVYRTDGTASGTGVFVLCNSDQDLSLAREIAVSITGRPQRRRTTTDCDP
jgi:type IV fimbrial biogenesis protein FimT